MKEIKMEKENKTEIKENNKTAKAKNSAEQPSTVSLSDLNILVTSAQGHELLNESGRTILTTLITDDMRIMSSFLGDYNKEMIRSLEHVNKIYFKRLKQELAKKDREERNELRKIEKEKKAKEIAIKKAKQQQETTKTLSKKAIREQEIKKAAETKKPAPAKAKPNANNSKTKTTAKPKETAPTKTKTKTTTKPKSTTKK